MATHRLWISAAVLVLAASVTQAQRAAVAPAVSTMHARTVPSRLTTRASGRSSTVYSRSASSPNKPFFGTGFGLFGQFPSFGLNNYGSWNPNWGIQAAIDPATQWGLYEAQKFTRNVGFGASGFYLLDGGGYYVPAEATENEQAPAQESAPAETETAEPARTEQQPTVAESAPLEDVGQFVLVLRSGTQIEAVAFTRANDRIIYVTANGFRRTLALADLDPDATIRINEERGTPLAIPL
jgi:hypothetical protein